MDYLNIFVLMWTWIEVFYYEGTSLWRTTACLFLWAQIVGTWVVLASSLSAAIIFLLFRSLQRSGLEILENQWNGR
jgi:hypothetical protein